MKRSYFSLLVALACASGTSYAQQMAPCGSTEAWKKLKETHPELLKLEADYEQQIQQGLKKLDLRKFARSTAGETSYDIPIVVHIVHDYNAYTLGNPGGDYISDDIVFNAVNSWNIAYAGANPDTSEVIAPFKKYIGNPRIRLHLATVDPAGNPTKGITRTRSYLTYYGNDRAKFEDWQPASYINIWLVNLLSGDPNVAAYAYKPPTAAVIPHYDGVIGKTQFINYMQVIPHEIGHVLNLDHPWGATNDPAVECGDDGVDDTPPTKGHAFDGCIPRALYDTACCKNYYKTYTDDFGNVTLVNYPDTANSQNIMDYTQCQKMFTKGQVQRMHAALENPVAGRSNLWSPANLAQTGALAPRPDLKPIPDFLVSPVSYVGYTNKNANFVFPNQQVRFYNETWNDTLTRLEWTFSNGADKPTDTSRTFVLNKFTQGGWATITMKATGNGIGNRDSTRIFDRSVFVADPVAKDPNGYMQEFDAAGDRDKWPTFNYYNNSFKWQLSNVGMYDNASMMYNGFDARYNPSTFTYPVTGNPKGDFDDLFTTPMNLSGISYLNFYYASASRTSLPMDISDTMLIDYSTGNGVWTNVAVLAKGDLINNGSVPTAFVPAGVTQWSPKHIALPAGAKNAYTTFRFRYKPGVGSDGYSSGNNFYLDRIYFSNIPASVNEAAMANVDVAVVPNPTNGNAYVIVKDASTATAQIVVSDITGKVVYTTSSQLSGNTARIEIPRSAIAVKGMYLVQTTTGSQSNTQKLVVY